MSSGGVVEQIDAAISSFFSTGNVYTVFLGGMLVIALIWPILTGKDPDIHPFLLARQAQASPVRQPGESAVYRATEIPYGYPLRKGLGVKDPGAPAWSPGRDGDLRDVWRKAASGATDEKGVSIGKKGKFLTILGKEKVLEQSMEEVTSAINAIGGFIQSKGGKTVAVSLSNSIELVATIFASSFYDFKPVLLPHGLESTQLESLLSKVRADFLIADAATVNLESALSTSPSIKNVIWTVREGSRHMDWTEKPDGVGQLDIYTWHDLIAELKGSSEVLASEKDSKTGPIATFWKGEEGQYELVEYPSETIIAGVGGLLPTLARDYRITHKDILLSTIPLAETYALCWILAGLYNNATIALNSVAGDNVDLVFASTGASPTIIITSSGTITAYKDRIAASMPGPIQKITHYFQLRSLEGGNMSNSKPSNVAKNLLALRVLLVAQKDSQRETLVPSFIFAGLRVALGTRVAYALTSASVAGAVAQTNILDYRVKGDSICFGPPVSSLELYLVGTDNALDQDTPEGKVVVRGPSVLGGKAGLDIMARIDLDRTVTLV